MESTKPPKGHFALLYFASAASMTKKTVDFFEAPLSAAALFKNLELKYPGIGSKILVSCAFTLNLDYVDLDNPEELIFQEGDEVAIIPPVSSG
jgi:molybdopterin converting factor small subunit